MRRRTPAALMILVAGTCAALLGLPAVAAAAPPVAVIDSATNPTYTTVEVAGEVNPGGLAAWNFEVSEDGGTTWAIAGGQNVGGLFFSGTSLEPVSGTIEGLRAGVTYKVRLTANNFSDPPSSSSELEFTTQSIAAPTAVLDPVTEFTVTTAHVTGKITTNAPAGDPSAADVHWHLECTPECPGLEGVVPAAAGEESIDVTAEGLRPGTHYEVSLIAENAGGPVSAGPVSFTTEALPAQSVTIDPVTTFGASSAHLVGHINPNAPAGDPDASIVHWHFHCEPISCPSAEGEEELAAGQTNVEVDADATGLEPNSGYEVTLVTSNAGGEVVAGPVSFTTATAAPDVETIPAFVLEGAGEAVLGARVNPRNSGTEYWFEYGPTTAYGSSTPHADAGSGGSGQVVSRRIVGLTPGTTYHFRVVAKNGAGPTDGLDTRLTTPVPGAGEPAAGSCPNESLRVGPAAVLHDCRGYELVSPPDMHGTSVLPVLDVGDPSISETWNTVADDGSAVLWSSITGPPGAPDSTGFIDTYRSRRSADGWQSTYVAPPGATFGTFTPSPAFVTPDESRILWLTFNATIDPADDDPARTATNQQQYNDFYREEPDGAFSHVNVGPFKVAAPSEFLNYVGASQDLSRVVFVSDRRLLEEAPAGGGIYQRDGQTTRLVSKDESGTPFPSSTSVHAAGTSSDASVVAFTAEGALYVWSENSEESTRAVSAPSGLSVDSVSADGRRVFFTTPERLSVEDTDSSVDLYEYDTATHAVVLLSAPAGGGPRGNANSCVTPLPNLGGCDIAPVTEAGDGSRVYFVSPEQLVDGRGVEGGANLYLATHGQIRFVATLDPSDPVFGLEGIRKRHVRVTPDGSRLIFESRARLTGYDNAGHLEVYLYEPESETLVCASCRPDGTPPTGDSFLATRNFESGPVFGFSSTASPPNSDDHGERLFFNSYDGIVPGDANGRSDVYEYSVASGVPALISRGTDESDSAYVGNGIDGRDVFFVTTDTLDPEDHNGGVYKLYDARVGGGVPVPDHRPACQGEGCQPSQAQPPAPAGTGSRSYVGPGNQKAPLPRRCAGKKRKVRHGAHFRCVKPHHRKAHKHKRARHHRKRDVRHVRGADR